MSILVIEHSDTCSAGMVGQWLSSEGLQLDRVRGHRGDQFPDDLTGHRALLVMGGPMNANQDTTHPWLTPTKALLREAVATELPTLGICLGHQLLAVACGGEVETMTTGQQLGLQPVTRTDAGRHDALFADLPDDAHAVHWNGDIVSTPPPGAEVLAITAAGVQALRVGTNAWGVQFHPEVLTAGVRVWASRDAAAGTISSERARAVLAEVAAAETQLTTVFEPLVRRFAALLS